MIWCIIRAMMGWCNFNTFRQPEELVGWCNKREVPGQGQLYNLAVRKLHGAGRQQVSQRHQHAGIRLFEHNGLFWIRIRWKNMVGSGTGLNMKIPLNRIDFYFYGERNFDFYVERKKYRLLISRVESEYAFKRFGIEVSTEKYKTIWYFWLTI